MSSDPWMNAMHRGDFAGAWRISDAVLAERRRTRIDCSRWPRHRQFIWDGSSLDGRRVLVRCYHGLGDTLQFARFLQPLRRRAREVTLWAQPALLPLLRSVAGVDRLLPLHDGAPDVHYDVDIEIMELAHALRVTLDTLPDEVPYIYVSPNTAASFPTARLKVGLAWRSGAWDERRSIPGSLLAALCEVPGIELYSLQYPQERLPVPMFSLACEDVACMARSMQQLDLVISVDTMVAHLASAMGLPTWTLLCREADWRWMTARRDSPWYPTMRLFRQRSDRWDDVMDDVAWTLGNSSFPRKRESIPAFAGMTTPSRG